MKEKGIFGIALYLTEKGDLKMESFRIDTDFLEKEKGELDEEGQINTSIIIEAVKLMDEAADKAKEMLKSINLGN